ncbi:hypothetical protein Dtox_1686 [Desulfofarcimen acetoxidans DSM 771]|jgi:AbrB family looped-hinge helix DNA binding protein|uniref:Transcriptional regulator, AbrB family n=1 Tax=Desulfofarcimen acetoxidans (strain ATCC 49208 / DSM 771 / KCTC 5769 / VKM B-1644 / 5575) TaxID=485916 RepID=C8VWW7_DESAS|nr:hypothetical protein [Desulfofarcimen acetoxidans]ACV62543.1 hypothetical protein Dtox_1686 [Desulfofarcimen acetoxidans DSM 771]
MSTIIDNITIDEYGQIMLPLEVNQQLNLKNNEWIKVNIKSDHILLVPSKPGIDEELLDIIMHEGILIDIE